ncbi:hypothetical protein [Haloarcula argentinensis]|nr:hypothetical protein [Haloarcula argentinensis]MDS0252109.1 hypothetical protein [Haloarcula argentinensis]GGM35092.1 hypothetical protein GCM10009006_15660 [Haloarcula argentinensis]
MAATLVVTVRETMTNAQQTHDDDAEREEPTTDHLDNVEDGCGCTEIWEHMSEERESESASDD